MPHCRSPYTLESLENRTLMAYAGQVVGYFYNHSTTNYAANLAKLDLTALTQLNYAFINAAADGTITTSSVNTSILAATVNAAHAKGVKVNITVDPGVAYTTIMADSAKINKFTTGLINFAKANNLDGIDLDWEAFPPSATEVSQYSDMLITMHTATAAAGLTLSAALVCSSQQVLPRAYSSLDWFNIMCYDIQYNDTAPYNSSIAYLNNWAGYGVPKSKLIMGVPFYGRAGTSWSATSTKTYNLIASEYQAQYGTPIPSNLDKVTLSGTTWGFNGVDTMVKKANYVKTNGFGGIVMWEITQDSWTVSGSTSTYNAQSLLPAIKNAMTIPFATVASGVLTIDQSLAGTSAVTLAGSGANLNVSIPGTISSFAAAGINSIVYKGTSAADSLTLKAGVTQPITYTGNGGADTLNVNGSYATTRNLGGSANLAVTVDAGVILTLSGQQTFSRLTSNGTTTLTAGAASVLNVAALLLGSGGKLDLNNNALVVDYTGTSPASVIDGWLRTGYAAGAWNGLGIASGSAASTTNATLGWAEASSLYGTFPAIFAGQSIDNTVILVRATYAGDANLDGSVDVADLGILSSNWQGISRTFTQGDFNYDGAVDVVDLGLLSSGWQKTMPGVTLPANSPAIVATTTPPKKAARV